MNIAPLIYWINERHMIYLRRSYQHQDPPWTRDPILQTFRFCNVFRELDYTTQWIRINWREKWADSSELWFWMIVARMFNYVPTLQALSLMVPDKWNATAAKQILNNRASFGEKIFTSAYMIRGPEHSGSKVDYVVDYTLTPLKEAEATFLSLFDGRHPINLPLEPTYILPTLQNVSRWLQQFHGIGPFLAYEIVTDLRHTRFLNAASDINTWANAGPGAVRGLNRLMGRDVKTTMKQDEALYLMTGLLSNVNKQKGVHVAPLELRDIEHSLCETDKYLRVKNGEGRPRERFIYPHLR
jgi:hypothetical protein